MSNKQQRTTSHMHIRFTRTCSARRERIWLVLSAAVTLLPTSLCFSSSFSLFLSRLPSLLLSLFFPSLALPLFSLFWFLLPLLLFFLFLFSSSPPNSPLTLSLKLSLCFLFSFLLPHSRVPPLPFSSVLCFFSRFSLMVSHLSLKPTSLFSVSQALVLSPSHKLHSLYLSHSSSLPFLSSFHSLILFCFPPLVPKPSSPGSLTYLLSLVPLHYLSRPHSPTLSQPHFVPLVLTPPPIFFCFSSPPNPPSCSLFLKLAPPSFLYSRVPSPSVFSFLFSHALFLSHSLAHGLSPLFSLLFPRSLPLSRYLLCSSLSTFRTSLPKLPLPLSCLFSPSVSLFLSPLLPLASIPFTCSLLASFIAKCHDPATTPGRPPFMLTIWKFRDQRSWSAIATIT